MAQITIPDELITRNVMRDDKGNFLGYEPNEVLDKVLGSMEQWARAKIGPLVTKDTPPNLYQDLKLRAIEDAGFSVLDSGGKDLLAQPVIEQVDDKQA